MYCPAITSMLMLLITFFIFIKINKSLLSLILLILLILESLFVLRKPKSIFEHRLNDYFIIVRYPFCKWSFIFQQVNKKALESECKNIYRNLSREIIHIFNFVDSHHQRGYYRTITHTVIKDRLKRLERKQKLKILTCKPIYLKDFTKIKKSITNNNCKRCKGSAHCIWNKSAKELRQFYFVEFYIF